MADYTLRKVRDLGVVVFIAISMGVHAQTAFVDTSGDHLWSNAANWDAGLPVSTSAVVQTSDSGQHTMQISNSLMTFVFASNCVDRSIVYRLLDRTNLLTGTVNTNDWDSQSTPA